MNENNLGMFNSDVWGTVSDWVMVLVTALTARYLWLTLQSQKQVQSLQQSSLNSQIEVQKLQQHSTTIENEKYRVQILPKLECKISKKIIEKEVDDVLVKLIFTINLLENDCSKLNVSYSSILSSFTMIKMIPESFEYVNKGSIVVLFLTLVTKSKKFDEFGAEMSIDLLFSDGIANKYSQYFSFHFTYTDEEINQSKPFRVFDN